jgi:hypothetical protein
MYIKTLHDLFSIIFQPILLVFYTFYSSNTGLFGEEIRIENGLEMAANNVVQVFNIKNRVIFQFSNFSIRY